MVTKTAPQLDWDTAPNPDVLLNIVWPPAVWPTPREPRTPATERRLQLVACACARLVWELLPTDTRNGVCVRERFADGRATEVDLRASEPRWTNHTSAALQHATNCARCAAGCSWAGEHGSLRWDAQAAASHAAKSLACRAAGPAPPGGPRQQMWHEVWTAVYTEARLHQAELVRDIFPPPGYAPHLEPDWRTSTVAALARQMDDAGDFSAVPILADALQDAGCSDDAMLSRCRAPSGIHSRGNWVVDLVLGRA